VPLRHGAADQAQGGRGLHSLTSQLNLRTFGTHRSHVRAQLEHLRDTSTGEVGFYGGHSQLKLSGKGQSKLKLSGNGNECQPLQGGREPSHGQRPGHPVQDAALQRRRDHLGRAVQVDPIKPKLKPPGAKRLKLECVVLVSTSAFKFNLRRYISVMRGDAPSPAHPAARGLHSFTFQLNLSRV
jgi:hypothetical protein